MLTARTVTGLQNWTSPDIGGAVSVIALALAPATAKKTVFNFRLAYLTAKSSVVLSCETNRTSSLRSLLRMLACERTKTLGTGVLQKEKSGACASAPTDYLRPCF